MIAVVGNRCGHDPGAMRLELVRATSSRRLKFIGEAMEAVKGFAVGFLKLVELEPDRQRRSERREAISLVSQALIYRLDLASMRVGTINPDGSCTGITVEKLAEWTAMHPGRVARALADLRDAGFETSVQPYEIKDGEYRGLAAIRRLTVQFFKRLGLSWKLSLARKRASARATARREAREAAAPVDYRIEREKRRLARSMSEREQRLEPTAQASVTIGLDEERMRRWQGLVVAIQRQHPDWPSARVHAEAFARL